DRRCQLRIVEPRTKAFSMNRIAGRQLLTLMLLTLIAPTQFQLKQAVAQSSSRDKTGDDIIVDEASRFRKMTVAVRDEQGRPLSGTKIEVMALESGGKKTMPQTHDYV